MRRNRIFTRIERDITDIVGVEVQNMLEKGEEVDLRERERLRKEVIENNLTKLARIRIRKFNQLDNDYGRAFRELNEEKSSPDLRGAQIASRTGILSVQYCNGQFPKLFDPVVYEVATENSFVPPLKLLDHIHNIFKLSQQQKKRGQNFLVSLLYNTLLGIHSLYSVCTISVSGLGNAL